MLSRMMAAKIETVLPATNISATSRQVAGAPSPSDSLILRFSDLTQATPARPRDAVLRALDVLLSALFLLVSLPPILPIAVAIALTSGRRSG